ncbi:MAG: elongation factor P [Victivallales bacterium]|nr:elongation factor P [Victivallales bacterium]MCF7889385.1 elongation factor P [Victivallales bacterium]
MFSASDLRKGLKVEIDREPWIITEFEFCKPGKGTALYRCKLKNMLTGTTMDKTYRSSDKIEKASMEEREMYFSYFDGEFYVFSDAETFDEYPISSDILGSSVNFLIENSLCNVLMFNGKPIEVELPIFIEKEIVQTEPGARGDTATNVTKPAKIDNGYEIAVPIFINEGDIVKIDTRTGQYAERVKKA